MNRYKKEGGVLYTIQNTLLHVSLLSVNLTLTLRRTKNEHDILNQQVGAGITM